MKSLNSSHQNTQKFFLETNYPMNLNHTANPRYFLRPSLLHFFWILWQQIIKRFDLSVAYANRSMAILWSLVWAVIFFHERVTINNVLGVLIVLAGTILVNTDGK